MNDVSVVSGRNAEGDDSSFLVFILIGRYIESLLRDPFVLEENQEVEGSIIVVRLGFSLILRENDFELEWFRGCEVKPPHVPGLVGVASEVDSGRVRRVADHVKGVAALQISVYGGFDGVFEKIVS